MFGEKIILGNAKCKVDTKGRILLPKFTYSEKDDEIVLSSDDNGIILLNNIVCLKRRINELEKNMSSESDERLIKSLNDKLERLYFSCISVSKVDSQRRLIIPVSTRMEYDINDSVILQGCKDHLKMFNSDESYQNYKMMIKQL
ncbi:protein MraZ [Clostridium sp. CAG:524]|jgi:DNA-binding transcriptional regulator/RsmH inhibitor MraZ|nr:protein MraZ [Clostridium sp. CAG:524]